MSYIDHIRRTLNTARANGVNASIPTHELERLCDVVEAAQGVEVISGGSGPAAPIFDEFDRATERNRGHWYTVDGKKFDVLKEALKKVV